MRESEKEQMQLERRDQRTLHYDIILEAMRYVLSSDEFARYQASQEVDRDWIPSKHPKDALYVLKIVGFAKPAICLAIKY